MIALAFIFLTFIGAVIGVVTDGSLDSGIFGVHIPVLGLFVFQWVIFAFIRWLRTIENRRG